MFTLNSTDEQVWSAVPIAHEGGVSAEAIMHRQARQQLFDHNEHFDHMFERPHTVSKS